MWFSWPPLEVGVVYLSGATSCLGMSGDTVFFGGLDSSVRQFANIIQTASIAVNCELQMLVGTSFSAANKKFMIWSILSSAVTWGCVIYSCKYSAVSVIINALIWQSIDWIQR